MRAELFLDTNILLYAASRAAGEQQKRTKARELLGLDQVGLSVQVLAELTCKEKNCSSTATK